MSDPVGQPGTTATCLVTSNPTTVPVCGDGGSGRLRDLHVDRYLSVRHDRHAYPVKYQSELLVHADLRRVRRTATGTEVPLNVTLTVTDTLGITTLQSGSGNQPPLTIKFFTCSESDGLPTVARGFEGRPTFARAIFRELRWATFAWNQSEGWSGRRGSNPRHRAWEARVLPLNYSRSAVRILASPPPPSIPSATRLSARRERAQCRHQACQHAHAQHCRPVADDFGHAGESKLVLEPRQLGVPDQHGRDEDDYGADEDAAGDLQQGAAEGGGDDAPAAGASATRTPISRVRRATVNDNTA